MKSVASSASVVHKIHALSPLPAKPAVVKPILSAEEKAARSVKRIADLEAAFLSRRGELEPLLPDFHVQVLFPDRKTVAAKSYSSMDKYYYKYPQLDSLREYLLNGKADKQTLRASADAFTAKKLKEKQEESAIRSNIKTFLAFEPPAAWSTKARESFDTCKATLKNLHFIWGNSDRDVRDITSYEPGQIGYSDDWGWCKYNTNSEENPHYAIFWRWLLRGEGTIESLA